MMVLIKEVRMQLGIKGYLKTPMSVEQVSGIIEACMAEYGDLRFALADRGSEKLRHTKKADDVRRKVAAGKCGIVFVSSLRNGVDDASIDPDRVSIDLEGSPHRHLPFYITAVRGAEEGEIPDVERFFDRIVVQARCCYGFGVLADTWHERDEELFFHRNLFWPACLEEIDTETERDRHLGALSRLERDFGRLLPQLYPINYISDEMLPAVQEVLREFVDPRIWTTTRLDGMTKITFTDILNRAEFQRLQMVVRQQL